jgi:hypothetical protein
MRMLRVLAPLLLLAASAAAEPAADVVRFAVDAEKARGHLLVSEQLYMLGEARAAALHAAHPVQELGNRLYGPVRRVDGPSADRLRDTLKRPGQAIEAKEPPGRYVATVASVARTLDDAVTRVAGAGVRASVGFRARVVAALLVDVAEEYEDAIKAGRIVQLVEYQDAYGFLQRAKALYESLPADARRADADMRALSQALPTAREAPRSPLPAKNVKALTDRIAASLPK